MADSWQPIRIISGGQTGVDRQALDVAISLGISHGGWCPAAAWPKTAAFPTATSCRKPKAREYPLRTEQNVLDSDATVILLSRRAGRRHRIDAPPGRAARAAFP